MRKMILAAATLAALAMMPASANAQSSTVGGGRGAAVGAVVGGTTGAAIGAQAEPGYRRHRHCWHNRFGELRCHY